MDTNTGGGRGGPPSDLWPAELSASFASIANQLQDGFPESSLRRVARRGGGVVFVLKANDSRPREAPRRHARGTKAGVSRTAWMSTCQQNSRATVTKMPIMALPMASGKPPPDHSRTMKGELEHLTKERYDELLQAYDQPIEGNTAAKRYTYS
ncbi:hypothetical protein V8E53_002165 [Lactarius tabidus]